MRAEACAHLALAFAAGSIPFGWILARLWGVADLRVVGSANVGATNVTRAAGPVAGALTFLLDFAKGLLPVLYLGAREPGVWIGVAAVAGHCFSPFLAFRGGKGVSTTLGAIVGFHPVLGAAAIVVYAGGLAITRVSALGSLFAMLAILAGTLLFGHGISERFAIGLMVALVLARHRENWEKLLGSGATLAVALLAFGAGARTYAGEGAFRDFRGRPAESAVPPKRIAALMPSLAETVCDLGACRRLVAAPDYARLPEEAGAVTRLGSYDRVSAESVYAAHPDLVLASMDGNDPALVAQLEKLGLKVVVLNSQSLADIQRSVELIAASLGEPSNPGVARMRSALLAPRPKRAERARVFVQVGWEPLVTISGKTFLDELVRLAGGENVFAAASMKYPRPNPEEVIAKDPDVIVICRLSDTGTEAERARTYWERFKDLKAVRGHKIFIVPGDWLTKPNLSLLRGIEELKRIL